MKKLTNKERYQLIKLVIGDLLFPLGFEFSEHRAGICSFSKKENDVTQEIEFMAHGVLQFYNIRISTTVKFEMKRLTYIILEQPELKPCKPFDDKVMGWRYDGRDELIDLLKQFCILIPVYIFPELEKMSVITDPYHIRTEIFEYMRSSVEMKQEQKEKGELEGRNSLAPDAIVDALSTELLELKEQPYPSIEKPLADLAVRYGEMLVEQFGGNWFWFEKTNSIVVSEIGGTRVMTFPLKLMIAVWKGEDTLQGDYQRICTEIPNSTAPPKENKKVKWIRHKLGLDWDD